MLIRNNSEQEITLQLSKGQIALRSGEFHLLNAVEVQLASVKSFLQQQILVVVRPAEDHETL